MKKKIINGILMVAMFFAATTSFVSCKDNVDDELIPVYAKLAEQRSALETQITNIQSQITQLQQTQQTQGDQINENKVAIQNLQNTLDALKNDLNTINNQISTLSADIDTINNELTAIKNRLDDLEEAVGLLQLQILGLQDQINSLITGIKINHTLNNVTGTWNLPGGISKMLSLAAFFGSNETGVTKFPNTDEDAVVIGDALTAADIAPAAGQFYNFDPDNYITQERGNAGMMFFTVNSEDPTMFDINDWTLTVENSVGRTAPITFSEVKPSAYQIQWGIYKSNYVDTDEDKNGNPTFFQARANIDRHDLEASRFDLTKFIDLDETVDDVKAAINNIKTAAGKKAKVEALVNSVAKILVNIYSGNMSSDNKDYCNPAWSAQKLVLSKDIEGITIKKYADDFDLSVSAVAPLSYNTFWKLEEGAASRVSTELLERAIYRLAETFKSYLPTVDASGLNITKIEVPENTNSRTETVYVYEEITEDEYIAAGGYNYPEYIQIWIDEYDEDDNYVGGHVAYVKGTEQEVNVTPFINLEGFTADGMLSTWSISKDGVVYYYVNGKRYTYNEAIAQPIIDAINEGLDLDNLADMINQVSGSANSLGNAVDGLADRFSSYIVNIGNKIASALANHAFTRALAPIVLYNTTEGIKKLAYGTSVKPGIMQINVTSLTEELLVPAYAKYIALFKDGKAVQANVYAGDTQRIDLNLTQAGEYTLVVSTIDYYGFVCNKKYLIKVN